MLYVAMELKIGVVSNLKFYLQLDPRCFQFG